MISSYLQQTAYRKAKTGMDGFGKTVVSAPVAFKCRFQGSEARLVDSNGVIYSADFEIWIGPATPLAVGDIVVFEDQNYRVDKLKPARGLSGAVDHIKAFVVISKE